VEEKYQTLLAKVDPKVSVPNKVICNNQEGIWLSFVDQTKTLQENQKFITSTTTIPRMSRLLKNLIPLCTSLEHKGISNRRLRSRVPKQNASGAVYEPRWYRHSLFRSHQQSWWFALGIMVAVAHPALHVRPRDFSIGLQPGEYGGRDNIRALPRASFRKAALRRQLALSRIIA